MSTGDKVQDNSVYSINGSTMNVIGGELRKNFHVKNRGDGDMPYTFDHEYPNGKILVTSEAGQKTTATPLLGDVIKSFSNYDYVYKSCSAAPVTAGSASDTIDARLANSPDLAIKRNCLKLPLTGLPEVENNDYKFIPLRASITPEVKSNTTPQFPGIQSMHIDFISGEVMGVGQLGSTWGVSFRGTFGNECIKGTAGNSFSSDNRYILIPHQGNASTASASWIIELVGIKVPWDYNYPG